MVLIVGSKAQFEQQLKNAGDKLVVVDFFAVWCPPCQRIAPQLEMLSKEFPNVVFLKVDVDISVDIKTEYGIRSMPTFVFIKRGKKVHCFSGASYEKLVNSIKALT